VPRNGHSIARFRRRFRHTSTRIGTAF